MSAPFVTADLFDRSTPSMSSASGKTMRRSSGVSQKTFRESRNLSVLEPKVFGERVAAFLRTLYPVKTGQSVEADTGIQATTVAKWLEGVSSPSGTAYHRLIEVYGAELVLAVSPKASPAALREAVRMVEQARLEAQAAAIADKLAGLWGGA